MSNKSFRTWGLGKKEFCPLLPFHQFNIENKETEQAANGAVISLQLSEGTHFPGFLAVH